MGSDGTARPVHGRGHANGGEFEFNCWPSVVLIVRYYRVTLTATGTHTHTPDPQALAVLWTGIVSTSMNFYIEITALGRVPSSEASVILATEPLWASLFAALLFHEQFGTSDYVGGLLMISACLVNTLRPSDILGFFAAIKANNESTE
jgi:drug/metabolite transporter (DMT)-like permease